SNDKSDNTDIKNEGSSYKKNQIIKDKKTKGIYKITSLKKNGDRITCGNVTYMGPLDRKCKKAIVNSSLKLNSITFKITAINNNAFKDCKKLKAVTIGSNVTKIGKKAFYGCRNLKTVKIKSTKIKSIGKKAFSRINKKVKFSISKKVRSKIKRMIKKSK
ncbi:MAG TPA: hypothetical protein DEO83_00380, partial [Lachnospiraceae bacterium]|nr:hypothetical protein [Lachnospiraceae bacterium]